MLMDKLTDQPPSLTMLHDKKMVSTGDDVSDKGVGTLAVDCRFLVNQALHQAPVIDNDSGGRAELERDDASILLGPFCELIMRASFGNLV